MLMRYTFMLILSAFSWLSGNNLFVRSSVWFLLNVLNCCCNFIYSFFFLVYLQAFYQVCLWSQWQLGTLSSPLDAYLCLNKYAGPLWMSWNQIYSSEKISSFQIIKKWQQAVGFLFLVFFFAQKKPEIWHVRNVQGGRLTEGVEVG